MTLTFYIIIFFLWAIMGSFAGVIIERGRGGFEWGRWKEILGGRSYCPGCGQSLTWWQLLPLVGWISQKGKCFRCKKAIPAWYNWMEITMGLVFVVTMWFVVGGNISMSGLAEIDLNVWIFWLILNRALWAIIIADFFWYELNVYLWLFLVAWIVGRGMFGEIAPFEAMFLRGVGWTAVFALIWWLSKLYLRARHTVEGEGIGEGDIMVALIIGMLFPFLAGSNEIISAVQLFCLYLIGSGILGIIFWLGRLVIENNRHRMLPFLPAMIVAFWLLLAYGETLLKLIAFD